MQGLTPDTEVVVDLRDQSDTTASVARRMVKDGTPIMAAGSLVAGLAAYAYQVIGGRALGEEGFAPVAALLSVHSLILAVLLTPVELLTVRRLTLARGGAPDEHDRRSISVTVAVSILTMTVFVILTENHFFRGEPGFVIVGSAVVATHALFALGRGALAGRGRYVAYGSVSGGAALLRVALAVALLEWSTTDLSLLWAVTVPPLVVLAFRPFRRRETTARIRPREGSGALMAGFVLAGAISQAFVLIGPLVAGALETFPNRVDKTVSVMFVTFSLARAPLLLAQNLAARLLAGLTKLVARNEKRQLRSWSRRLGLAGIAITPVAYLVGAAAGPPVIGALFGSAFRPEPLVAGLAVAGCALAAASIFLDQVLIALGATGKLAAAWTVALALAGITVASTGGSAAVRVSAAVLIGELAALLSVMVAAELADAESPDSGYDLVKRAIDLVGGIVFLVATGPIQIALAVAIKLDSAGPVFFRQPRIGKNDRVFTMVKFRSMEAEAGEEPLYEHLARVAEGGYVEPETGDVGPHLWIDEDPRITRVGGFLRRTSLDELPNLWNVALGHMSLVGPRPLVPAEVELLGPKARARARVKPGMTGLAQVRGGSDATFGERAAWDLEYVDRRSLALDAWIMARTPLAALGRRP